MAVALHWRPLVYNFDGYMYPLEGLDPLDTMNAHHLFWIPMQALFNTLALKMGVAPRAFCQIAGIGMSGLLVMVLYLLTVRISSHKRWSCVVVIFLALSPQYWFLTMQNLPYVPFFIFVLLCVWACFYYLQTLSRWPMVGAVTALAFAVQFQQAGLLLFFPLALFFLWNESKLSVPRWGTLGFCFLFSVFLVCGPYLVIAHLMNIDSVQEFRAWVTDYLDSQHGLQYRWLGLIQAVIGMVRCVVQSDAFETRLSHDLTSWPIAALYSVIGCLGLAGVFSLAKYLSPAPHYKRLFKLCLGFIAAWSFFLLSWEPLMAHFWCITLILALLCLSMAFSQWTRIFRWRTAMILLGISGWNAFANIRQDRLEQTRNPDRWLAEIRRRIGPQDFLVFMARNRIDHIDYDLLAQGLSRERPDAIKILLPDEMSAMDLRHDLESARQRGVAVWLSGWIFDPMQYRDIAGEHNIFSPYPMKNLRGIDGARLYWMVRQTLQPYAPSPSDLVVGHDRFFENQLKKSTTGYFFAGLIFTAFYFFLSPPLFNYDGYLYRLQGLASLQNINQTHLIWIPFQWGLWQLSYLLHTESARFFQAISILILAMAYRRSFLLWARLSGRLEIAAVLTFFLSPARRLSGIWDHRMNPTPCFFLCVVSSLSSQEGGWGEARRSAAFWLSLATLLHQAAVLLCIGYAVMIVFLGEGPLRTRIQKAAGWLTAVGFFVGGSYFLVAYLKGIHTLPAFWNWLVGYLHTQHHLQGRWYEDFAKSLVGVTYTLLPLQPHEDSLYAHFNDAQIRGALIALSVMLALLSGGFAWRMRQRIRTFPWREEPVVGMSLMLILSWSIFAIFWEPTNYYWAVPLFPALTLAARALRSATWRPGLLIVLALISVWSLTVDHEQDEFNAQRFVEPQLQRVRQLARKK